ncbi:HD domain-containing phosphohydrolase [Clostridium vincentii]|uniref:Cyclic di-GMP phosphodiesterase response regulator RpfG n=1 Tax=Clostridium vincentii TaxID=52704 RepID=A0A2T0BBT7_9CLOT|nr:HD domain-containing phosphohydrolase [Clostridium vincentii]PRR81360.1 Cyclic di-GMP phosphodiesterase response regulator RpfG [Clostridium vincentii]
MVKIKIRSIRIQTRLIVSFLLLSIVPLAATSLISYKKSSDAIQTKINTYSVQVMDDVSRNLQTELTFKESLCEELAMTDEIQKNLIDYTKLTNTEKYKIEDDITLKFVEKMRLSAFNASSDITSLNIIINSNVIMGTGQNNYDPNQLIEIYNETKDDNYKYNYTIVKDLNGNFQVAIDSIIKNHITGEEIGTLILTFKDSYISDICKQLEIGEDADVLIMDSKGKIVSSNDESKAPINKEYLEKTLIQKVIENNELKQHSFSMDILGEKRLVAYNRITNCDWFIVSTIPYTYLQEESKSLMLSIIFIGLVCLIFAIPLSFIISFSISRPLSRLKKHMNEVQMGKLDIELSDNNSDEIAEISTGFNDMISSIRLLIKDNIDTQNEIVYKLGAVTEARSQETGNHIKRVAQYSKLIALKYGIPEKEADIVRIASTLHDVGKISIPDNILLKPGKLTVEEFEIMKTHAVIGNEILSNSNKKVLKIASIIALEHHERYDGTGYPRGISGDKIGIYSRIVSLTDVFDALATDRVYKKKWEFTKIVEYIKKQRGKQFDPKIVDIFLANLDEIKIIQNNLSD